jgi:AcrR family transcriptional regulator
VSGSHDPDATRVHFIRAAIAVFAEHGFKTPSIQDICDKAGYSRSAFYVHFKDREDVLGAALVELIGNFVVESVESDQVGDVSAMIANFIAASNDASWVLQGSPAWRFHHTLAALDTGERVRKRYLEAFESMRRRVRTQVVIGQRDGRVRRDIDADALAGMLLGMAYGAIAVMEIGPELDFAPIAAALVRMLAP